MAGPWTCALAAGETPKVIQAEYREEFGAASISIPSDKGLDRALWAVPITIITLAAGGLWLFGRRMARRGAEAASVGALDGSDGGPGESGDTAGLDAYEQRLERELEDLDE